MKTPSDILVKFEQAAVGLDYGSITLTLFIKQGRLRYLINREESYVYNGEPPNCDKEETA